MEQCVLRSHYYIVKILRHITKKSVRIPAITSFICFHCNNGQTDETVHFTFSLYTEEMSRGFIVYPR